jgi:hypothetical protein
VGNERAPWAKRRSEQRKRDAALRYDLEMESRKVGWGDPALVYDEEKDLFRFVDGKFAFSREHADWELLRKPPNTLTDRVPKVPKAEYDTLLALLALPQIGISPHVRRARV